MNIYNTAVSEVLAAANENEVRLRFTLHLMIGYLTHIIFLKIIVRVKIANQKAQCKT